MIRKVNWAKFKRISYKIHSTNFFRSCKTNALRNASVVRYSGFSQWRCWRFSFFGTLRCWEIL